MIRLFFKFLFKITGWKIAGDVPPGLKKYVLIVAPHTSMWDFYIGVAARSILRLKVSYLGKKELFKFPQGPIMKALGGYPVDRGRAGKLVDQVAEIFHEKENFAICITPEGTRKKVDKWKTGFYHIAKRAGVPIVMVGFDFKRKLVDVKEPFMPGDDLESDLEMMREYYRGIPGKHPELGIS